MKKDTAEIVKELGLCPDFQTFYQENKTYMVSESLAELLNQLIERKGIKKSQAITFSPGPVSPNGVRCWRWLWVWD